VREQIYEAEQVKRSLHGLSGMDNVIRQLEGQIEKLEQEKSILNQMVQALSKILLSYSKCENHICDNAEQSVIVYQRREIVDNDFSELRNIIDGI
jgi:predicted RNase H-like nuclease (RuvC/YqgF family)